MRALIVDDDDLVRRALARILVSLGIDAAQAGDGFAAIDQIESAEEPFDLIFCDLQMPGRDGIQTLRDLAARKVTSGLVLLSGHTVDIVASAENTARHHALNVLGHLYKPFDRDAIKALVALASEPRRGTTNTTAKREPLTALDLRRGIAMDEFRLVFQPKVNPVSGVVEGVESLVRWAHGRYGLISPVEFIGLAEDSAMIDQLTDVVMRHAIDGYHKLRASQYSIPIAVNLSTRSMSNLDLADRLQSTVMGSRATPDGFVFEVTESRLADSMTAFLETATRLRLMGFKLSIDDFGTGFSTMEQVSRLPISELKIDRAFVAGSPDNPRTRHILEASLQLGHSLSLKCVCEGVETTEEWELVHSLGTDNVQGYFVAKPMEMGTLIPWIGEWYANWGQKSPQ